jgi:hypothetical protein
MGGKETRRVVIGIFLGNAALEKLWVLENSIKRNF